MIVSLDIETTGLDPDTAQILEIGAVVDDLDTPVDKLPRFHCYVEHEEIQGNAYALSMHPKILRRIATREEGYLYLKPDDVVPQLKAFLSDCTDDKITFAGKNFAAFDLQFLKKLPGWDSIPQYHRYLDPGSMLFDPMQDTSLPNSKECMQRAGISGEVAHTAIEDAVAVIKMIRFALRTPALAA